MKLSLPVKWLMIIYLLGCQGINARAQTNLKKWSDSIYQSIYARFYLPKEALFTETNQRSTDEKPYSYLWPLCALVQAANEMEEMNPGQEYLQRVRKSILQYRDELPPTPGYEAYPVAKGGDPRFYDDNQWIGLAYIDAYRRTKTRQYLDESVEIYRFMMTGFDTMSGGGLYWKETEKNSKNTCSNGPGILLALRLYQVTNQQAYLDTAMQLYEWINRTLRSPEGLYYDALYLPKHRVDSTFYTYNSGTMIQANAILYEITKRPEYLAESKRLAEASLRQFFRQGKFPNNYWFNAVLLRGYVELYRFDKDRRYLDAMHLYTLVEGRKKYEELFIGKRPVKLLDLAGLLEITARLAIVYK